MNSKLLISLVGAANAEMNEFVVNTLKNADYSNILTSLQPDGSMGPSKVYQAPDLIDAVIKMTEIGVGGEGGKLIDGPTHEDGEYALVNIAAFLAETMQETIQFDACDENNWDKTSRYSAASACGQLGQSYQDYTCKADEAHMQCEVDPMMEIVATTHASWNGAPGPLFCAPKSKVPKAPKWNTSGPKCSHPQSRTPFSKDEFWRNVNGELQDEDCHGENGSHNVYAGQLQGGFEFCDGEACPNNPAPQFHQEARSDVEGCCWWGRGIIQLTGVCNFGKLNYFAGARAHREGRPSMFPTVDFCKTPNAVCDSKEHPDLKWITGFFFWTKNIQSYPKDDKYHYDYMQRLMDFTKAGDINDESFINSVSGIVNRGCPELECSTGKVDAADVRARNFKTVLKAFGFPFAKNAKKDLIV